MCGSCVLRRWTVRVALLCVIFATATTAEAAGWVFDDHRYNNPADWEYRLDVWRVDYTQTGPVFTFVSTTNYDYLGLVDPNMYHWHINLDIGGAPGVVYVGKVMNRYLAGDWYNVGTISPNYVP